MTSPNWKFFKKSKSTAFLYLVLFILFSLFIFFSCKSQNVSPEKLNKGLTHSLTMTFKNEYDRDSIYLPHPTHVDFGEVFVPELENLVVYDYWSNN